MKKILIIGKESYIGESIFNWLKFYSNKYEVDIVSPLNYKWKEKDFKKYETVINLTGIAHIKNIKKDMKDLFYSINRDLVIEIAKYAKENKVKHFIHFSSMNVYGDYCGIVTDKTKENPTSFYGDSKLQGDIVLNQLKDKKFMISIIRPPFVYGKGCKGNYNTISKIAKIVPGFPTYKNKKSMIYIDNLCEFTRLLIDDKKEGVFTPQNKEIVSTFELVKEISLVNKHKIKFIDVFNWVIPIVLKINKNLKRAFTDDSYKLELSNYYDFKYCVVNFEESIRRTELSEK